MGANSRKRRDAKARGAGQSFIPPYIDPSAFNRAARSKCSQCGSADIEWTTLKELAILEGPRQEAARELLPVVGASAEAWTCNSCEEFGAFEQTLHSSWN